MNCQPFDLELESLIVSPSVVYEHDKILRKASILGQIFAKNHPSGTDVTQYSSQTHLNNTWIHIKHITSFKKII